MKLKYLLILPLFLSGCYNGYSQYDIGDAPDRELCQMQRASDKPEMIDTEISARGLDCKKIALPGDTITKANVGSLSNVELCQEYESRPNKVVKARVKNLSIDCKTTIDRWYQQQQLELMKQQVKATEAAESQARWAAVQNNLNQQRMIQQEQQTQMQNQMNAMRPVTTRCSKFGYQMNCTSY